MALLFIVSHLVFCIELFVVAAVVVAIVVVTTASQEDDGESYSHCLLMKSLFNCISWYTC